MRRKIKIPIKILGVEAKDWALIIKTDKGDIWIDKGKLYHRHELGTTVIDGEIHVNDKDGNVIYFEGEL